MRRSMSFVSLSVLEEVVGEIVAGAVVVLVPASPPWAAPERMSVSYWRLPLAPKNAPT